MMLCNYLKKIEARIAGKAVNTEIDLEPTADWNAASENSLLFIFKRVSGEYSLPENVKPNGIPYAIVCDEDYRAHPDIALVIRVDDPRAAYAHACYLHLGVDKSDMKIIGVTGTNGKTTTATLIHSILNKSGVKAAFVGTGLIKLGEETVSNEAYTMTTPDPELLYPMLKEFDKAGCKAVVMEVSSHALALGKLSPLNFDIAVFTNLSHEHMDFHNSIEEYFLEKRKLFEKASLCLINIDDAYGRRLYEEYKTKSLSAGVLYAADYYATDIESVGLRGLRYFFRSKSFLFKMKTALIGCFNIYNTMLAAATAITFGIAPCDVKKIINLHEPVCGRMEIIHKEPTVIIDYAHTPLAVEATLKEIRKAIPKNASLITVLGCGGNRDKGKRPKMGDLAAQFSSILILTEDNSRNECRESIIADILSGIPMCERKKCDIVIDRKMAIKKALDLAGTMDAVVILGKGHERYIIDKNGKHEFDERAIVKEHYNEG